MKNYIFITYEILGIGGGQCYVAGKAQYLEKEGWSVLVFSPGYCYPGSKSPIQYLNKYLNYIMPELLSAPFMLPPFWINNVLRKMQDMCKRHDPTDDIVIESHDDKTAFWGELLAERVNGKHYFYTLNETFRGEGKFYEDKIDFFLYKYNRREILGSVKSVNRLFESYMTIDKGDIEDLLIDEDPVQDVLCASVENLQKNDYCICYLGRAVKPYVPNILNGIGEFATRQKDKIIHFVIVGDVSCQKEKLNILKSANHNLVVTELGDLHPLPRSLFSKVDVVIAGSGSARCAVEEGALTIVADPESKQALGILGYDTNNSVYKDKDSVLTTFSDALQRTLIDKVYLNMPFKYPHKIGVEECTKQNFRMMEKADKRHLYYSRVDLCKGEPNVLLISRLLFYKCHCKIKWLLHSLNNREFFCFLKSKRYD